MSDMKCPFCNGELVGTIGHPICRNQNCVMCDDPMPQDLLEEVICTRKALGIAKEALNDIQFTDDGNRIVDIRSFAHHALEQITALEQKD